MARPRPSAMKSPEAAMRDSPRWAAPSPASRKSAKFANFLRRLAVRSSTECRLRRGRLFIDRLKPLATDKILDLGGGRGGHMAEIVPFRDNVTIADADANMLSAAETH